ncbi:hypothetical protein UU9_00010 [Rhodanobacter fulvus Jip2]|uniref:Uncharacterized protein n=1 Tax=Rhodanobacter fulvus Jip2 TaxID=1163408 RepID=I4W0U3_9GAMM|nr:hypothetical protein [Rhodanobacter fulvus]EIL93084.1 hypothetical protein UU9_00010 [Rhodanobacter fulvus Jip2]
MNITWVVTAFLLPLPLMAASAFDGTWKIDVSKVHGSGAAEVITLKDGMYTCNCAPPIRVTSDGTDQPISGRRDMDTMAVKIVDDHTVEQTAKKDGKVVYTRTYTVSPDGKTAAFVAESDRGKHATFHGTLTRVGSGAPGSNALAGSWQIAGYQSVSESKLTSTYKVDGDTVSMSDGEGESYTAKLGGNPVEIKGDPDHHTIAVKMVGNTLQETDYTHGKVNSISKMTVSSDGKQMTTVTTYKPTNRGITLVAYKQ